MLSLHDWSWKDGKVARRWPTFTDTRPEWFICERSDASRSWAVRVDGCAIGRFTLRPYCGQHAIGVAFSAAPAARTLVLRAYYLFFSHLPLLGVRSLWAEIHQENVRPLRIARHLGFVFDRFDIRYLPSDVEQLEPHVYLLFRYHVGADGFRLGSTKAENGGSTPLPLHHAPLGAQVAEAELMEVY